MNRLDKKRKQWVQNDKLVCCQLSKALFIKIDPKSAKDEPQNSINC